MAKHEVRDGFGVRGNVESLFAADAGDRAGRHVANGIAAGFARGDANGRETPHQSRRVFNVDVVKLDILASSDVGDVVRIFFAKVGQHLELWSVEAAEWNLDALHAGGVPKRAGTFGVGGGVIQGAGGLAVGPLTVVITLAICATAEAGFS